MEVFEVDAEALARRTAAELRADSDHGDSDDGASDEDEDQAGEEDLRAENARKNGDRVHVPVTSRPFEGSDSILPRLKRKRVELYNDLGEDDLRTAQNPSEPLASSSTPPCPASEAKDCDRQRKRRRAKRKMKRDQESTASGCDVKPFCAKRTAEAIRKQVEIDLDSSAAREPLASSGFVCLNDPTLNARREKAAKTAAQRTADARGKRMTDQGHPKPVLLPTTGKFSKAELEAMGMTEDEWDGFVYDSLAALKAEPTRRKCQTVYLDCKGRELVLLCGQPRDTANSNWSRDVADAAFSSMEQAAAKLSPLEGDVDAAADGKKKKRRKRKRNVRRGDHRAETVGVGVGNGRQRPRNFHNDDDDDAILTNLLASEPFIRIAGFAKCAPFTFFTSRPFSEALSAMLFNFAPRLHNYYEATMDALFNWDPRLRRIFAHGTSVFPSATFNFGPQTVTIPHLDLLNLAWGWCFITALGNFDPTKGGHLILWDLKRFIRFPPGATIAIPSALLRHSNVSIQQDEIRYSFTQFAAGGLFRFVENGFQLNKERVAEMNEDERNAFVGAQATRFAEGLKMYNVHALH
ncbi:hypothetical protein HMN09_01168600 [Mycena chlorophos]|uniref:Uncharacterized protein n=1 Tax=Mycena chlorophos TaxID=658473 RepID=A0A8H6S6E1_MYCCL|nr:hypothetical protein HMN09_01168600 [Mycena chlorophos]